MRQAWISDIVKANLDLMLLKMSHYSFILFVVPPKYYEEKGRKGKSEKKRANSILQSWAPESLHLNSIEHDFHLFQLG